MNLKKKINYFSKLSKSNQILMILFWLLILIIINFPNFTPLSISSNSHILNLFKAELTTNDNTTEEQVESNNINTLPVLSESEASVNNSIQTEEIKPELKENPLLVENTETNILLELKEDKTEEIENSYVIEDDNITFIETSDAIEVVSNIENEARGNFVNTINNDNSNKDEDSSYGIDTQISAESSVTENIDSKIDDVIYQITSTSDSLNIIESKNQDTATLWSSELDELRGDIERLTLENNMLSVKLLEIENKQIIHTWGMINDWIVNSPQFVNNNISNKSEYEINLENEKKIKRRQNELKKIINDKKIAALNEFNQDTDLDWLSDKIEDQIWTNPMLIDTDSDWYSDFVEINKWSNPLWEWDLFVDWKSITNNNRAVIINSIKKWLVFVRVWDLFSPNETIYKEEALKILVNLVFPFEVYSEIESFSWITAFHDLVWAEDELIKYSKIWQKYNIFNWIVSSKLNPYDYISKADFVKMLVVWMQIDISQNKIKWVDTEYDNWFTSYFSTLYELEKLKIEPNMRLKPLDKLERLEILRLVIDMR